VITQGRWDRQNDRNVYFLAGNFHRLACNGGHRYLLIAVNELTDRVVSELEKLCDDGVAVLLDSGIFWLTNEHKRAHGITMNEALALHPNEIDGFDDLLAKYLKVVDRLGDKLWGVIELDQGGKDRKRETRAMLHSKGVNPIPVYHPLNDGWDYFDELASQYDRIAIGNVVQADAKTRLSLLTTLWERRRRYPDLWVHMLGYTLDATLLGWPVDSADSSTWLTGVRWAAGTQEFSLLSRAGMLGPEFGYVLGSEPACDRGAHQAVRLGATTMKTATLNWRSYLSEMNDVLGLDQLPAFHPNEPKLKPGKR